MNKVIIIGDVHIGDYPNYESHRYERLEWYDHYADIICKKARDEKVDYLFIAGDFLDRPVDPPEVMNVAKSVVEKFTETFKQIYYILGQHDLKTKNYDIEDIDRYSMTNAIASKKMIYADHTIQKIAGRTIAFQNFNPDPDLDWIKNKVDLFVSHVTIDTNGFGTDVDYEKFDLGIAGDIHYPCQKNNLYSTGVSLQRYLGDSEEGTYILLDLESMKWSRELIDPEHKYFTHYRKCDDYDNEGPSEEVCEITGSPKFYNIYTPPQVVTDLTFDSFTDDRIQDIDSAIQKFVARNKYEDIHKEVIKGVNIGQNVDMNFKLKQIEIWNVRSIEHVLVNLDLTGTLQIQGINGSGKSSLIWCIYYALKGGNDIQEVIKEGTEDEGSAVRLTLEYQGKTYTIYRGTDGVQLDINGEFYPLGSKRETEAGIHELLPFTNFIDSFFFTSEPILGGYSPERRIQLLSTYYRLDIIEQYHNAAEEILKQVWVEINEYAEDVKAHELKIQEVTSRRDELKTAYEKCTAEQFDEDLENCHQRIVQIEEIEKSFEKSEDQPTVEELHNKVEDLQSAIDDNQSTINSLKVQIQRHQKTVDVGDATPLSDEELKKLEKESSDTQNEIAQLKSKKNTLRTQIENYETLTCPFCKNEIGISDLQPVNLEDLQKQFKETSEKIPTLEESLKSVKSKISEHQENVRIHTAYQNANTQIGKLNLQIEQIRSQITKDTSEMTKIKSSLAAYEDYLKKGVTSKKLKREYEKIVKEKNEFLSIDTLTDQIKSLEDDATYRSNKKYLEDQQRYAERLQNYIQMFAPSGILYENILKGILHTFNSDSFKYEIIRETYRGRDYLDVTGFYKSFKMKSFRHYSKLSRGQTTLLDLDFIRNLVVHCGLITFDETLGFLTTDNQIEAIRIINAMKPSLRILTNQNENSLYIDHSMLAEWDGNKTEFVMK